MTSRKRTGWGRTSQATCELIDIDEFDHRGIAETGSFGLTVGLGRSYGDSSLITNGATWSCRFKKNIDINRKEFVATCGSGVTIGELERAAAEVSLFPPVVPGTEYVTIGGAVASNIHGKSHHSQGAFGNQLKEITLLNSKGEIQILTPEGKSELFWATVGGMGLTGAILSAKIKLIPIKSQEVLVREKRVNSLEQLLSTLKEFDTKHVYTVAWIDLSGKYSGRGIVSGGSHAEVTSKRFKFSKALKKYLKLPKLSLPDVFPSFTINKFSVRLFNELWFRKPLKNGLVHYSKFMHPLDSIKNWNRLYGHDGFLQYQIVIPLGCEDFFDELLSSMKNLGVASFLGVVKLFGDFESRYLSFPLSGWTIAIDIPASTVGVLSCLDRLDEKLVKIGGRVYLTKDSRISSDSFSKMYPDLDAWKKIKEDVDPSNYWQSNQGRRLNLC
jgi:decaprenylphospho-beta-D-ribofuranose 2-oxidase